MGYYVLLAHLKQSSMTVFPGQRVVRGAVLGHCGNSGRSPVPHLHMHVQNTIYLGTPTRPFCLKHYIETSGEDRLRIYKTSRVPATDARIQTPSADPVIGVLFAAWLPGEYRYRITFDIGASWEETFRLDFDENSAASACYRAGCEARLPRFISENVFYTTQPPGERQKPARFHRGGAWPRAVRGGSRSCLARPGKRGVVLSRAIPLAARFARSISRAVHPPVRLQYAGRRPRWLHDPLCPKRNGAHCYKCAARNHHPPGSAAVWHQRWRQD